MKKHYTEVELNSLITEIETQFHSHLEKAESADPIVLAKADDMGVEAAAPEDKKPEEKDEDKDKEEKEKKDKKDESEEPAMEKTEEPVTVESLYSSMTKSEQEAHFTALSKVMGTTEVAPMAKSEGEDKLVKAESQIAELAKSNDELKKTVEQLVTAMKSKVGAKPAAPKGRAVTQLAALEKSEKPAPTMTREAAKAKLSKVAQSTDLKKSDRDLINKFCYNEVGMDAVQHLL